MNQDEQITILKKLVEAQETLIAELRKQIPTQTVSIPSIWPLHPQYAPPWQQSCQHEYPNPWMATVPPTCKKCGISAPSYTITSTDITGYVPLGTAITGGEDVRTRKSDTSCCGNGCRNCKEY